MSTTSNPQEGENRYIFNYQSSVTQQYHGSRTASRNAAFFLPHLSSGMTLLDCGCGAGSITLGLAETVAPAEVVGIDISQSQIEKALDAATKDNISNVRFETASVYELPFPAGSFEAAFAHGVLEHLDDPLKALKEMHRILKPGGVIGVRSVDYDGLMEFGANEEMIRRGDQIVIADFETEGGDPYIGKKQRMLLQKAGFGRIRALASYDTFPDSDSLAWIMDIIAARFEEPEFIDRCLKRG